jgi:hypothetical protein
LVDVEGFLSVTATSRATETRNPIAIVLHPTKRRPERVTTSQTKGDIEAL